VRRIVVLVGLVALMTGLVPAHAAVPSGSGSSDPTLGPLVAGTASYVEGFHVWTDYAYDDSGPGGSASYPLEPGNLADLIQLQFGWEAGEWVVRAVLQTLLPDLRDAPLLGVGFDVDASADTGAPAPPGSWVPAEPLGLEVVLLAGAEGARLLRWGGAGWEHGADLPASVDPERNVIEVRVPAELLDLRGPTVHLVGLLGLGGEQSWAEGRGPVYDLAYVGGEEPLGWQDARQSSILAGERPGGVATVDLRLVRAGRTVLAPPPGPGFHTRLYRSDLDLGEGIRTTELEGPGGMRVPLGALYAGLYQPYLVWLPEQMPARSPLVVYLHGFSQTHTGNAGSFGPAREASGPEAHFLGAGGFEPEAVVVFPLGRGEMSFYMGEAEQDVLDVVDDALEAFGADADRVVVAGVSMGGFGAFRLGVRYPDRWSAVVPLIGTGLGAQHAFRPLPPELIDALFPPGRFPGGTNELLENLRNVPLRMVNGQVDPIVQPTFYEQDAVRLLELGYDFRLWVLARRHHEVVPALADCVLAEAVAARRVADPARVTYSVRPALAMQDPSTGLDLRHDRAYWVSEIAPAPEVGSGKASVDVVTLARADRAPVSEPLADVGENLTAGADLCGPNPDVRTGDAWHLRGMALGPGPELPVENAATLDLAGVLAAAFDLTRMTLDSSTPLRLDVTTTHDGELHLDGDWSGRVDVFRDGEPMGDLTPDGGRLVVPVVAGDQSIELRPATSGAPQQSAPAGQDHAVVQPRPSPAELPATGPTTASRVPTPFLMTALGGTMLLALKVRQLLSRVMWHLRAEGVDPHRVATRTERALRGR
jgi:pimeloyl-ACP methyl ester carboxylesterase